MTLATATFRDIWAGDVSAALVSFRTSRNGATVTRYRWQRADGASVGIWRDPSFPTVERACAAASRHPAFSNVAEA